MTGFSTDKLKVETFDGLNFTLLESFTFTRPNGEVVTINAGAQSDGASTPTAMRLTLPPFGVYWPAAFGHDDLYRRSNRSKSECDTIFEEMMECLKVPAVDRIRLYQGVEHLGEISFEEDRKGKLTMWGKFAAFFKGFFGNAKADPVNTVKGVVQLAAAGAAVYGMATGIVPVPIGAPVAASFATSGLHAIGTNTVTGVTQPEAVKASADIQTVAALVPTGLSVVDQIKSIKAEADAGQKKIDTYQAVTAALAAMAPPAP
jgi:hypothetical protein